MKQLKLFFILLIFLFFSTYTYANQIQKGKNINSYFIYKEASAQNSQILNNPQNIQLETGSFQLEAPPELQIYAVKLHWLLQSSTDFLNKTYSFNISNPQIKIILIPKKDVTKVPQLVADKQGLIFPLPVDKSQSVEEFISSFSSFEILRSALMAKLAFGNQNRRIVSSHAYPFLEGLSGFMALESFHNLFKQSPEKYLNYLDLIQQTNTEEQEHSALKIMEQNRTANMKSSNLGFNQFFAGVRLAKEVIEDRQEEKVSSRIKVFSLIQKNQGKEGIKKLLSYLNKSKQIWKIKQEPIDGARANLIINFVADKNWSELVQKVKQEKPSQTNHELPAFSVYSFDYPVKGGVNQFDYDIAYQQGWVNIHSDGIVDWESLIMKGFILGFGVSDESRAAKIQLSYASGENDFRDEVTYQGTDYSLATTIYRHDLFLGSRIIELGDFSGYQSETGLYFRWNRMKIEWDVEDVPGSQNENEYVHRSYLMAELQNYRAYKLDRTLSLGLNFDFQLGSVMHSGSTSIARNKKYNKDSSQLMLGGQIGPELRLELGDGAFEFRTGAEYEFFYQPFDDEGGIKSESGSINSTQKTNKIYATLGISF